MKVTESKVVQAIVMGDGMVGKTSIAHSKLQLLFTEDYQSTIFENFGIDHSVGGEHFTISLFDTGGRESNRNLRTFAYSTCHVVIMCFSVCDKESFQNVIDTWMPEVIAETRGSVPIILVGTQADTRGHVYPELEVSVDAGYKLAEMIGADAYVECSALTEVGIDSVFNNVIYSALKQRKKKQEPFFKRIFGR